MWLAIAGHRHSSMKRSVTLQPHDLRVAMGARIFVTTLNTGACTSCAALGDLNTWLPKGYDVYVIGVRI